MKNEVTQDEIFAMKQFRKGKEKGKGNGRKGAGTVVKVVTTAEIARMTNKTTAGQMGGMEDSERQQVRQRCRQRMERRQEQLEQLVKQQGQRQRLAREWQVPRMVMSEQTE